MRKWKWEPGDHILESAYRLALPTGLTMKIDLHGPRCGAPCPSCGAPCDCPKGHGALTVTNHVGVLNPSSRCCFFGPGTLMPVCQGRGIRIELE